MADKKIPIKPSDMERLREFMRQEEAKFDAANPSDEELVELERQLEDSARRLSRKTPGTLPSHEDEMKRNWAAIERKMQAPAEVLPLVRKQRNKVLPWIGVIAAAALVMIMIRPRPGDDVGTMSDSQVTMKGNTANTTKTDCEVDVRSLTGSPVKPSSDGLGFVGTAGTEVEVSVRCHASGFLQVKLTGPEAEHLLNTAVTNGERQRILRGGKIAGISLQSSKPWSISLVLTDRAYPEGQTEPQGETVLWQDTITVRAQE